MVKTCIIYNRPNHALRSLRSRRWQWFRRWLRRGGWGGGDSWMTPPPRACKAPTPTIPTCMLPSLACKPPLPLGFAAGAAAFLAKDFYYHQTINGYIWPWLVWPPTNFVVAVTFFFFLISNRSRFVFWKQRKRNPIAASSSSASASPSAKPKAPTHHHGLVCPVYTRVSNRRSHTQQSSSLRTDFTPRSLLRARTRTCLDDDVDRLVPPSVASSASPPQPARIGATCKHRLNRSAARARL
jgi:hypothetical protein